MLGIHTVLESTGGAVRSDQLGRYSTFGSTACAARSVVCCAMQPVWLTLTCGLITDSRYSTDNDTD